MADSTPEIFKPGLVIERKIGQRVRVGTAWVEVVAIRDECRVKLRISAPRDVQILREEVDDRREE